VKKFRNLVEALEAAPSGQIFLTVWVDEDESETITFGEFRRRARAQAGVMRDHGVEIGDRVVLVMPQSISAMAAFAGAMMLGAVPAFLAYPNFKIDPSKYRSGLAGVTANLAAKVVIIDTDFPEDMLAYVSLTDGTTLLRAGGVEMTDSEIQLPELKLQPEMLAFIQHSAGTTGLQKGVALTHGAVLRQLEYLAELLHVDAATDRIYSWLPLYHDMGLIACFMLPMVCHLPVVMQSPLDWVMHPETMLQIIGEHRCTLAWMPNFAFQFVSRRTPPSEKASYDLSSLRALLNCSEPVRASSMDEFLRTFTALGVKSDALHSSYAMAENVFAVTQSTISEHSGLTRIWADGAQFRARHQVVAVPETNPGSICFASSGRLLPNHEVRIISDSAHPLEEGCVGEILIKSDCLFDGYYNRPDLTSKAIIDGWYYTGDLGFLVNGELYVVGRKKDLLIVGGENLYPQDIEEIIGRHSAIHEGRVVAVGVYNPDLGTDDIVVVAEVDREESLANAEEIENELRKLVVAGIGVAVRRIMLKPPKWIVKSTAGKAARSATREKLFLEHPELNLKSEAGQFV
jgi:fatty-acyl-CoA synthase